jgi:hypothetical protein
MATDNRQKANKLSESILNYFAAFTETRFNFSQEYLDYDISRQIELESYGYRFLRLNKFNLHLEQDGETKTDVLDRFLRKAFAVE